MVRMPDNFRTGNRNERCVSFDPLTIHHSVHRLRTVGDCVFFPGSFARIGQKPRGLFLQIKNQLISRAGTEAATTCVLPNVIANVGRIQQEVLTNGSLIDL